MQQDYKTMTEWVNSLIDNGLISRNKGLKILGMNESEDVLMDLITVDKSNLSTLEDALNPEPNNII